MMKVLQSPLVSKLPNIQHGFFYPGQNGTGPDRSNNLSFKNGEMGDVLQARKNACGLIQLSHHNLTHVYQVHGTAVWKVDESQRGAGAIDGTRQIGEGDAMITNVGDTPLAVLIADCLPVFLVDQDSRAVGIVHAGWRGSLDGIVIKTIEAMKREYGIQPQELLVWIAPGISHEHFEVGREVWDQFADKWGLHRDIFYQRDSLYLDIKRLNCYQLVSSGILTENIEVSPECTYARRDMFSYRRDGAGVGHNMAVIGMHHG
jgi:YfiH family protein